VAPVYSPERYRAVVEALRRPGLDQAPTVVSVFVSPVDTEVDKQLWKVGTDDSAELRGRAALANAALVAAVDRELAATGAEWSRLAWAGTGVRDPYYPDLHYLDGLPAGEAVRIVPPALLAVLADQEPATSDGGLAETLAGLDAVGVDLGATVQALDDKGVERFTRSWQALVAMIEPLLRP
jgi:transaldolase